MWNHQKKGGEKMNGKIRVFVTAFCILFVLSVLANSALARPSEPLTYDYAEFRNDPYPKGTYCMTIYYHHDSYCTMLIYLIDPTNSEAKVWSIDRYSRSGYLYYNTAYMDGVWRLQCYMSGYLPYVTDAALVHNFGISDPEPEQDNLGSDWARHPQNSDIYNKAFFDINEGTTSSYLAAEKIYSHVLSHFIHLGSPNETYPEYPYWTFRKDLDLLNDLETSDHYYGVCRSDAVILTAYARALGIPARIIHLHAVWPPHGVQPPNNPDEHYFAEFYVSYCGSYQWAPVDGDPSYNWFGIYQANQKISERWPKEVIIDGRKYGWTLTFSIVTNIPHEDIIDDGFYMADYLDHPYINDL